MRLRTLRLRNFRGTEERSVEFADGVTVVEGPNEVGKSSLADALDLLFDEFDSTKKKEVLAAKPVDRDAGPEIEAEIESGPYRFRYRKRFLKRPETVLEILAPKAEQHTGRAAHDRALAILEETIDRHLWGALRVQQGAAVTQAEDLAAAPTLARALDRTAGQETAGERELTLFELVEAEYLRYYTEKQGLPRGEVKAVETEARDAARRVTKLEEEFAALEADVARSEELERRVPALERELADARAAVARRREELDELKRRTELGPFQISLTSARMQETKARQDREARDQLVQRWKEARAKRERIEAEAAHAVPALEKAQEDARDGKEAFAEAETAAAKAEKLHELREKDLNYQHFRLDLEQMREREARIRAALEEREAARALLGRTRIDDAKLQRVRDAHLAAATAHARLEAGSARIELVARAELQVELDGEPRRLAEGETLERRVVDGLALSLPGLLDLRIRAGTQELLAARDEAEAELAAALAGAGVAGLDEAEQANALRRDAARTDAECAKKVEENLRDLTLEELHGKIERLATLVARYPEERTGMPTIAAGYETAKAAKASAKEARARTARELEEARRRLADAEREERELREKVSGARVELRVAIEAERAAETELGAARLKQPDAALDVALKTAEAKLREAQEAYEAAQRAGDERQRARDALAEAERAVTAAEEALHEGRDERQEVRARLELRGERGFFEQLEEARTVLARAEHLRASTQRRAVAARTLYEAMTRQREKARRAYAAPLRDRIVELGRYVFDDSFDVELDEELRVRARTLDGKSLPFEQLSVGAREQIGLVARLACALLVDEEDGVPLIFDDTLGHTDPERLQGMGAMLAKAGERCQIVLLTCTPDRFRVEGAKRVELAAGGSPATS